MKSKILRTTATMVTNWFLRSLQMVLVFTAQCQPWEVRNVTVMPDDLDAVVGRWNSNLTCVLNRNMQGHYNASDLYFTYQIGPSDTMDVPLVYVNTINDSAIELRHFPEIDPILITKENKLAVKYVTCRIKGQKYGRNVLVQVRKPHENPQVKDIVVENWETLSFDWETKEDSTLMYKMEYKAWYWNGSNDAHPLQCKHSKNSLCKVPNPFEVAFPGDMLIIKVNGSVRTKYSRGILETVTSKEVRVNLTDYLRPRKINQINVSQNQFIKTLVFKPPKTNQRILYNINVNCTKPLFTQSKNIIRLVRDFSNATQPDRNSQKIAVTEPLVRLPPYSNCTVSVRAISVEGGNWSEWTYHDFQTMQDVPLASIRPDDLDAVVGRWNANITCVLNRNMQGHYNASDLYFTYQIGPSDTMDVALVYVNTINDSAIELRHFPEIDPILITKENKLAVKYVTCRIKGQKYGRNVLMQIRKPHENPQIKDIVVENWETLNFAWETKEDLPVMHSMVYKAWYWNGSNYAHPLQCKYSKNSLCKVPNPFQVAFPGDMLIIKVNGSVRTKYSQGILETVTSKEVRVNLTEYLRPRKVNQIKVTQNKSIKTLAFKPPKTNRNISYDINVNCAKPSFNQSRSITRLVRDFNKATQSDRNSQNISVREPLVGLPPYSNCTVFVRAISVEGGKWSAWTYHDFQTLQDVPLASSREKPAV